MPIIPGWDGFGLKVTKMDTIGRIWQVPPIRLIKQTYTATGLVSLGTIIFTLYPDDGYMYEGAAIEINIERPPGSLAGSHKLTIGHDGMESAYFEGEANFDQPILLSANTWRSTLITGMPADPAGIARVTANLRWDFWYPMKLVYYNGTNVNSGLIEVQMIMTRREVKTS